MNSQAAQTMPELPAPDGYRYDREGQVSLFDSVTTVGRNGYTRIPLYDAGKMLAMYQQGYAAALSQTAGVAEGRTVRVIEVEKDGASRTSWSIDGYGNTPLPDGVYKIVRVERPAMIERAAMLAAAPAASGGGGDYSACCDTPAYCSSVRRCTAKDSPTAGASVSERARDE